MKAITHCLESTLAWKDPVPGVPTFELSSGGDLLATLALEPLCRTRATAETAEGTWTLEESGILSATLHVREEGSTGDLAVFHPGFLGRGRLRFGNGVSFRWRHHPLQHSWTLEGEGGETLLTFRREPEPPGQPWPRQTRAGLDISPAGRANPRVPLLAALGWYLVLRHA